MPRAFAHSARRCIKARESPPPDSATAPGHGAPSPCMASAKARLRPPGFFCWALDSLTAGCFARAGCRGERGGGRFGVFGLERGKSGASSAGLPLGDQRLAQLQHTVRTAVAVRIFLDLLGKGAGGTGVVVLNIGNIADPVDRLGRQIIVVGIGVGISAE